MILTIDPNLEQSNEQDEFLTLTVTSEDKETYKRFDQYIAAKIEGYSRTFFKKFIFKRPNSRW